MAEAAKKILEVATYEDLLQLPEHLVGEIINGELYAQPRPAVRHARAASVLDRRVGSTFDAGDDDSGGWLILFEPELHLGDKPHILVPDLAGWRRERMPRLPDTAWIDLAPDWVCEVISPSTASKDKILKMPIYREMGVEWLWMVDPEHKTLEAYQSVGGHWILLGAWGDNDMAHIQPFDAVGIPLGSLWIG
ncbi:MAG: Uma2 family endonuclease [Thiothrix sp.]|uniref:Uma2 family endonuclease n=1 Tax=Thiothrix sp. TaxID=1032 RepID=UPI002639BB67|nr:Uma2 family endonuclease [Thiothrix sp.]MDD5394990.1 Uma2 family endonuclease [Thiothrix sp.]